MPVVAFVVVCSTVGAQLTSPQDGDSLAEQKSCQGINDEDLWATVHHRLINHGENFAELQVKHDHLQSEYAAVVKQNAKRLTTMQMLQRRLNWCQRIKVQLTNNLTSVSTVLERQKAAHSVTKANLFDAVIALNASAQRYSVCQQQFNQMSKLLTQLSGRLPLTNKLFRAPKDTKNGLDGSKLPSEWEQMISNFTGRFASQQRTIAGLTEQLKQAREDNSVLSAHMTKNRDELQRSNESCRQSVQLWKDKYANASQSRPQQLRSQGEAYHLCVNG